MSRNDDCPMDLSRPGFLDVAWHVLVCSKREGSTGQRSVSTVFKNSASERTCMGLVGLYPLMDTRAALAGGPISISNLENQDRAFLLIELALYGKGLRRKGYGVFVFDARIIR